MIPKRFTKPETVMLTLAFVSLIISQVLWFEGEIQSAIYTGLWVPSILAFAIYIKLIKIQRK